MIYLDHHACAPLAPGVREAMTDALDQGWANPSSVHGAGQRSRQILERGRAAVADAVGAHPGDLVFTSGGTEACNLALLGCLPPSGGAVLCSPLEHPAVQAAVAELGRGGVQRRDLALVNGRAPDAREFEKQLGKNLSGVCIQWVNHENGMIFPVHEYARVCREAGVALVVDGCQALGKLPVDMNLLGASAVAFGASKCGGPAGVGALWVDREVSLRARTLGGAQERGRRGGSPDLTAVAGFGAACAALPVRLAGMSGVAGRRDALEDRLQELGGVVNPVKGPRVATVTNLSFAGWRSADLVAALDVEGLCVSAGAACASGAADRSPVIAALWPDEPWRAESAVRISIGNDTSEAELEQACACFARVLSRVAPSSRGSAPA